MIPISTINTSSAKPTDCVVQAIVETWLYDVIKIAKLDRERNTSRPSHRHFSTKSSHHLIRTLDHRTFAQHRDRQSQQCPYVSSAPPGRQAGVTVTMDTDTISD